MATWMGASRLGVLEPETPRPSKLRETIDRVRGKGRARRAPHRQQSERTVDAAVTDRPVPHGTAPAAAEEEVSCRSAFSSRSRAGIKRVTASETGRPEEAT